MVRFAGRCVLPIVLLLNVVSIGCQREQAAPARPSVSAPHATPAPDASTTVVEPAEEDSPFELESEFVLLGRDQFDVFGPDAEIWKATADGISCTGKPRGYLYSQQSYENFNLRLEYRFTRPKSLKEDSQFKGNTGFLVYITGEQKLWPACLEVQGKYVQIVSIKENGGADPVTVEDNEAARLEARRPVGKWNALEIISKEGALTVKLNGTQVAQSQPGSLKKGQIGIQAEDFPFEVRRLRIHSE